MRKARWMVVCTALLFALGALALAVNIAPLQAGRLLLTPTPEPTPPANINLVQNGDFAQGNHNWAAFNAAMQVVNIGGANGNVMELARWAGTTYGGFYQFMPYPAPANGVFEFTFQLGNMSSTNRVINMLLRDGDWQDVHSCFINLPPFAPLQNFTMTLRTSQFWQNIVLQGWVYVGDYIGSPPLPFRFDNLDVRYRPSSGFSGTTECPGAAIPPSPTPSRTPTRTNTATVTQTPTRTNTPTPVTPSNTPTPSNTQAAACTFVIPGGDVAALITAVNAANVNMATDIICLGANSVYALTSGSSGDSTTGLPPITSSIIIRGNNATIQRSSYGFPYFRIFKILETGTLGLFNLTVQNGNAAQGGGIWNAGYLHLTDSAVVANISSGSGGGIWNAEAGTLSLTQTDISSNYASQHGGGLLNSGVATILDSRFRNNSGGFGGGLNNDGSMTIERSLFSMNNANVDGGAIRNGFGRLAVQQSCFGSNTDHEPRGADLSNHPSQAADAANNWWGSASGPIPGSIGGNVITAPFLTTQPAACSFSPTLTPTRTFSPTYTPSNTRTPSNTWTPSNTRTPSRTLTPSNTPTPSRTPSNTFTPSRTFTPSNTPTITPTFDANQLVVTNLNDSGSGSLRAAVAYANAYLSDDTITFAVSGTIRLNNPLYMYSSGALTIDGAGAIQIRSSQEYQYSHIVVSSGATIVLNGLSLTGSGYYYNASIENHGTLTVTNSIIGENNARGIYNAGTLTVVNTVIRDNGQNDSTPMGGGIYNFGTLLVIGSTFSNNGISTDPNPNYVRGGGAIANAGSAQATIINSLFTGNVASQSGGAILNTSSVGVTVINSTFRLNPAAPGGGQIASHSGTLTIQNSIISDGGSAGDCVLAGGVVTVQSSLVEDGTCGVVGGVSGNLTGDPLLNYDLSLSAASPAVDSGDNALIPPGITTDVNGSPRVQGVRVDMGAFEMTPLPVEPSPTITPTPTVDPMQLVVTTLNDSGAGSLRAAIAYANRYPTNDTITFAVSGAIQLTSGQLVINSNGSLAIQGGGAITISGDYASRVFSIQPAAAVTLDGLTIINGVASSGAGVSNFGTLTVSNSAIMFNRANGSYSIGGGVYNGGTLLLVSSVVSNNASLTAGGGIYNAAYASLTIQNSDIRFNEIDSYGGGLFNSTEAQATIVSSRLFGNVSGNSGGAIYNRGMMQVANSMLTDNTAISYGQGGAIYNLSSGTLYLMNSTLAANRAINGAGILLYEIGDDDPDVIITNSIVAGNYSGADCIEWNSAGGSLVVQHSLIGDGSCGIASGTDGNLTGDPLLNSNFSLTAASPAVDAGDDALIAPGITTDIAGSPRIQGASVDMGAYELTPILPLTPTITPTPTYDPAQLVVTTLSDSGPGSLRAAVAYANTYATNDTITFAVSGVITLTSGQLVLENNGAILMDGGGVITIDGSSTSRIFLIGFNADVTLNSLTITNGREISNGGGIYNMGSLTLNDSAVTQNRTQGSFVRGGGIFNEGTLFAANTLFSGNAAAYGGGLYNAGVMTLFEVTFADNTAVWSGGGIANLDYSQSAITNSTFLRNTALDGGAISTDAALTIANSLLAENTAISRGGAVYVFHPGGTLTVINSTMTANNASIGGGIYVHDDYPPYYPFVQVVRNSVLSGNTGGDCVRDPEIHPGYTDMDIRNSLIGNGSCLILSGINGNLTGDPLLNPDYTLSADSPAVDAGNNAYIPAGVTTDLAGNPRIQGLRVDMGAYESGYSAFSLELLETATPSSTATASLTPTATVTETATPTPTTSETPTATATPTVTTTLGETPTPSMTATSSDTPVPTPTPTETAADTPSATPSDTPSATATSTDTPTFTDTPVPPTDTATATELPSPTVTPSETPTSSPTETETPVG